MKIAVTGASGFIGRHLVEHLSARGDAVTAIRRPFQADTLRNQFSGMDAVVHLAGLVSARRERDFVAANVDATRVVAEAARDAGVRLVHVSSLAAAGPAPASAPRAEDDEPRPAAAYGRSKLAGERVLLDIKGLDWIVLRPGGVYGPGDRALLPLFRMARRGVLPLVGRAGAAYTLIHVLDAVRAIAAAVDTHVNGTAVFVGHPSPAGARDILEGIQAAVGGRARIVRVPMPLTRAAAMAGDFVAAVTGRAVPINAARYTELAAEGFVCRVDRLRDRLGFTAQIDLRGGLARTAEWYRREGWIR